MRASVVLHSNVPDTSDYYTKDSRPEGQTLTEDPHSALWVKEGIKDKKGNLLRKKYEQV
jgi:hypothetical protein